MIDILFAGCIKAQDHQIAAYLKKAVLKGKFEQ
jgi:hypothetical protein